VQKSLIQWVLAESVCVCVKKRSLSWILQWLSGKNICRSLDSPLHQRSVCACERECVWASMCLCERKCAFVCVFEWEVVSVCVYLNEWMCVFLSLSLCVCLWLCVCVSPHPSPSVSSPAPPGIEWVHLWACHWVPDYHEPPAPTPTHTHTHNSTEILYTTLGYSTWPNFQEHLIEGETSSMISHNTFIFNRLFLPNIFMRL